MRISIVVRFHFEGIHSWPDVPDNHPATYLRNPHRHLFYVQATKRVSHEERDIEIIEFKKEMKRYCGEQFSGPHTLSCETMARKLLEAFNLEKCRVLEDGENGAEVERGLKVEVHVDGKEITTVAAGGPKKIGVRNGTT